MGSKALKKQQWTGLRVSMTTLMLVVGVAAVLIALLPAEAQQPREKPLQTTGALEENEANAKDGYRKLEESRGIIGVELKEEGHVRKKRGLWGGYPANEYLPKPNVNTHCRLTIQERSGQPHLHIGFQRRSIMYKRALGPFTFRPTTTTRKFRDVKNTANAQLVFRRQ
ncbi:Hypp6930 [Branchiostoma lanceolatum]|uniref:Hypp6930 protein n=1 Tax=Branchiostoma lanceolatum TaxID=7740 RepID=A0A8J9YVU9_BRALA|nr:Hypp6930 [Branchiostoma lanceolatum]